MSLWNWVTDSLASEDIIDLYFIVSDLVDIPLTEGEIGQSAMGDSLANEINNLENDDGHIPNGKRVR